MIQYQYKGDFHKIYDDYKEFREFLPLAPYQKHYWKFNAMKQGTWVSTADGRICQLLKKVQGKKAVELVFPFKRIRVTRKFVSTKKGYILTPSSKLYYNEMLNTPVAPTSMKSTIRGVTKDDMDRILVYVRITGDIFDSISRVIKKRLTPQQMGFVLDQIKLKEPAIMEKIMDFVDKIDQAIMLKTGKPADQVIAETFADLLTDKDIGHGTKKENIMFYLKFKHLTVDQLLGLDKGPKGTRFTEVSPPLLD